MDTPKVYTKKCRTCKEHKPLDDFHFKDKLRGLRQSNCKLCMQNYAKQRYLDNREEYIDRAKSRLEVVRAKNSELAAEHLASHPCNSCGEADPRVLKLSLDSQELMNKSPETILGLLPSSTVLCLNCREKQKPS
jgi:hypothetical protein